MTLLLLPVIRKTAAQDASTYPRIVALSSDMHYWAKFTDRNAASIVQAMDDPTNKTFKERYQDTKLFNILFTRSLAAHLRDSRHPEDKKITVSAINPGLVSSEIGTKSDDSIWGRLGITIMISLLRGLFARNIMGGAKTTVYAAIEPQCGIENGAESGLYYSSCRVARVNTTVEGEDGKALGERLWKETIETIQIKLNDFDI